MIEYLIKTSICIGVLTILYLVFLRKETFLTLNRFYLLSIIVISMVIPQLTLDLNIPGKIQESYIPLVNIFNYNGDTINSSPGNMALKNEITVHQSSNLLNLNDLFTFVYLIGFIFFLSKAIASVYRLYRIIKNEDTRKINSRRYNYILTDLKISPFSFFNNIFLPESYYKQKKYTSVIAHEQAHAKQLHSLDLLITEALNVILWFNPFIYLYRKMLIENHEYLADRAVVRAGCSSHDYSAGLVRQVYQNHYLKFISSYKISFIRRRLKMIYRKESNRLKILKILWVVPGIIVLTLIFSRADSHIAYDETVPIAGVTTQTASLADETDFPSLCPINPVDIRQISSGFGMRIDPFTRQKVMHSGIDIAAGKGTPVFAAGDGIIVEAGFKKTAGNYIYIKHDDVYSTYYAQLSDFAAESPNNLNGRRVVEGEIIGFVGSSGVSTGPHLHYEIIKNGKEVDPAGYFTVDSKNRPEIIESDYQFASLNNGPFIEQNPKKKSEINISELVALINDQGEELNERPDILPQLKTEDGSIFNHIKSHILYPEKARKDGKSGIVIVQFKVDELGKTGDFSIVKEEPANYGFGDAVITVLKTIPLTPAIKDGKPVSIRMANKVLFKLE